MPQSAPRTNDAGSRSRPRRGGRSRARSEARKAANLFAGRTDRGDPARERDRGGGPSGRGSREHPARRARTRRVRAVRDERGATRCGRPRAKTRDGSAIGNAEERNRRDIFFGFPFPRKGDERKKRKKCTKPDLTHNLPIPSLLRDRTVRDSRFASTRFPTSDALSERSPIATCTPAKG